MRLTAKTYTDAMSLPLFGELEKLNPPLPSLIASLKSENSGLKEAKVVQSDLPKNGAETLASDEARETLTELVPPLEKIKMAEGVGFVPKITIFWSDISRKSPLFKHNR